MIHNIRVEEIIEVPINNVWEKFSDFNGLADFHPAISDSKIEAGDRYTVGSVRYLTLQNGDYVREQLLSKDDRTHQMSYSIMDGDLPLKDYVAHIELFEQSDDLTKCVWSASFEVTHGDAEELKRIISENVFRAGFIKVAELYQHGNVCTL